MKKRLGGLGFGNLKELAARGKRVGFKDSEK
jgi:hypothetical protein